GMIDELQKENKPQAEETNEANSAEKTQETTHAKPRKKRQGINLSNIKVECERILPQPAIEHPEKYDLLSDECAEVSDHLEYKPAKLYVHRTIRVKCALKKRNKSKNNAPICAPAPKTIIPGSYVGASLLAHIAYSKYALHLPCERQLNELARMGVPDITNQHLCGWLEKGAQALEPLYNIIHATLFKQDALHVDETPIRCLKQEKLYGYMWLMTGSQSGQTYYHWATSRSSHELDHLLRQNNIPTSTPYQGIIITDNYVGYDSWVNNISIENQRPIQASCWTHARRKFVEAKDKCADPQFCEEIISAMKPFYSLEREIRETKDISLNERLQVYLDHPEAGIDNNPVERAVRKV
ncbi:MAG: transposase, partial [Akkermansia sp.]